MFTDLKNALASVYYDTITAHPALTPKEMERAAKGPLVVAGLFRTASGIGASARLCAASLQEQGLDVHCCDLSAAFNQVDLEDSRHELRPFPDVPNGVVILHLNPPEMRTGLLALGLRRRKKWRTIGYWIWEFETIPDEWRAAEKYVSEIWTSSTFCANSIKKAVSKPTKVAPYAIHPPTALFADGVKLPAIADVPDGAVVILCMADNRSSFDRKNLSGAIDAFMMGVSQDPNCWLIVKTRNLDPTADASKTVIEKCAAHPRIILLNQSLSENEKWALLSQCDVFLSLHRSEGFGLVIAEAMSIGKAVIATGWSGNLEFMDENTAFTTPFRLIEAQDQSNVYQNLTAQQWADPDIEAAAKRLHHLVSNPEDRKALGERAKTHIRTVLSGEIFKQRLEEI